MVYRDIDQEIADVALKYFLKHATCWLSPKNVAVSVCGETPPHSVDAVKGCMLPDTVDIKSHLMDRTTRLKHFFSTQSKIAPCISYRRIPPVLKNYPQQLQIKRTQNWEAEEYSE